MTVHLAVIEHRHGFNHYAGATEAELTAKIAEFCREWWDETDREGDAPEDDDACIEAYFQDHESEWLTRGTDRISAEEVSA